MQSLGFGDGSDGALVISSNTTEAPIDSTCSGLAGQSTLSVGTGLSFAAGQIVLVWQTRGTGAWEVARVLSYSGSTLTLETKLVNNYSNIGANKAQVRVVKQYSSVTIQAGFTYTAKAWDGVVGGILAYLCNGQLSIAATAFQSATGKGFLGGAGSAGNQNNAFQGESPSGAGVQGGRDTGIFGIPNGGGGGAGDEAAQGASAGGGGAHSVVGNDGGQGGFPDHTKGLGGTVIGAADLSTALFMGPGGGGGGPKNADSSAGGAGAPGGGVNFIVARSIANSGGIVSNGGTAVAGSGTGGAGGGGGAGGSNYIRSGSAVLGAGTITASGSVGGAGAGAAGTGGTGGAGRNRFEICSYTGSATPTESVPTTAPEWCASGGFMY